MEAIMRDFNNFNYPSPRSPTIFGKEILINGVMIWQNFP
jgi:hypothetical protein